MSDVPEDWTRRLAAAIAAALREFTTLRRRGKPVVAFDVGCFPWHGFIELSILTTEEVEDDPLLLEPRGVASWRHYSASLTGLHLVGICRRTDPPDGNYLHCYR